MKLMLTGQLFSYSESWLVFKMFYLLVSLQLLLVLVNGHTISKRVNNTGSDIYEIKEDKASNTITFVNPMTDHQTLREIVYYHLIERPYGENEKPESLSEDPELDETERPFTNSHGFPFLESFEKEPAVETDDDDDQPLQELEENAADEEAEIQVSSDSPIEEEEIIYYDEDEAYELSDASEKETAETKHLEEPADDVLKQDETTAIDEITMTSEPPTTTPVIEPIVETKAKHARKLLFDRVRERYYSKTNDSQDTTSPSTLERRKRDISMDIPEAPTLGPINFDSLPPYLRTLISTEKPTEQEKPKTRSILPESDDDDESERLEKIRHKMKNMMTNLKNPRREEKPKPRTYGMNLTEDHGYVWNDIWSKSGIHYNVDGLNSIEEDSKTDGKFNKNTDHDGGIDEANEETAEHNISDDEYEETEKPDKNIKLDHSDEEGYDEKPEDFDYHDHKDEKKDDEKKPDRNHDELDHPDETKDDEKPENFDHHDRNDEKKDDETKPDKNHDELNHSDEEEIYNGKPEDLDHHDEKIDDEKEVKANEDDDSEDQARKRKNDKNKETIDELLENEQFWNWLADWTSVYMDVLADHINDIVKEEVSNQIKQYEDSRKNDNKETSKHEDDIKPDKKGPKEDREKKDSNEAENNEKIPENEKKDDQKPDDPGMNDRNIVGKENDEDLLKKRRDRDDKKKPDNSKIDEKPSKIEKEPTNNKTEVDDPKSEEKPSIIEKEPPKNKTEEENKSVAPMVDDKQKEYPTKIQAQNLYGNSVGSEKVTNIFIFYPNSDTNQIIKDIKNDSNSEINVFGTPYGQTPAIDERINVPDGEKNTEPQHENYNKVTPTETNKKDAEIDKKDPTTESLPKEENDVNNVPSTTSTESPKETTTSTNPDVPSTTKKIDEDLVAEKDVLSTTESNIVETSTESIKDKELEDESKDNENGNNDDSKKDRKDNLEDEKDKKAEPLTTESKNTNEKDKELNDESKIKENESNDDSAKDKKDNLEEKQNKKDKTSTTESTNTDDKKESESKSTENSVRESSTSELPEISSTAGTAAPST